MTQHIVNRLRGKFRVAIVDGYRHFRRLNRRLGRCNFDTADGGIPQLRELYHGSSVEQLDAVVDLLMNFDEYTKRRSLIAPLVQEATPVPADGQPAVTTAAGTE